MNSGLDHANTRSLHQRKLTCGAPGAATAPAGSRPDSLRQVVGGVRLTGYLGTRATIRRLGSIRAPQEARSVVFHRVCWSAEFLTLRARP